MKRAAIYARVSKAYRESGDDRLTIDVQLSDCEAYCQEKGYLVVARYVDKDKYRVRGRLRNPSGARKDRPQYRAMLKAAMAGEFHLIVAWKEDRLYRGMFAALPMVEVLDERRKTFTVELVKETFDRSMLEIKAAIAKMELDNIRQRMIAGRRARLERGEVPGGNIRYGYGRGEDKRLSVIEAEAAIVRQIFTWYNDGESSLEIRRRLNASDTPARRGRVWSKATIQNVLTFEGYTTGDYVTTLDGEEFAIACPPIISLSTWQKSREVRRENTYYPGWNVKEDYLVRGMVKCACGWTMGAKTHRRDGRTAGGYYRCALRQNQPEQVHPDCPGTIGSKKVDDYVWRFVLAICEDPALIQRAIDGRITELQAVKGDLEREAERLQTALDRITEGRQWVITQARTGRITDEDMDMQLGALDFQTLGLRKEHEEKLAALTVQQRAEQLKIWAGEYLADIGAGFRVLDTPAEDLSPEERDSLYTELEAGRFEDKFSDDRMAALKWAILEKKRRVVRILVDEIRVIRSKDGGKDILPRLAFDIPLEYGSLVSRDQSLDYRPWDNEIDLPRVT